MLGPLFRVMNKPGWDSRIAGKGDTDQVERLQKILSRAGVASRRASERLMLDGRVTVNGTTIRELGTKADPARDDIRVDDRRIKLPRRHRYLLLNKPRGYVTTRSDPQKRPTVIDLLRGVHEYVYPVGRLDFDSEGLLLLTNDGDLADHLTRPSHGVARVYDVEVVGVPDAHRLERLARGVTIEGRRTAPADVQLLSTGRDRDRAALRVTIREGRNRQVRKMFDAIGHPVNHLRRVAIGPIRDGRLKPGQWRDLKDEEVRKLRAAAEDGPFRAESGAGRSGGAGRTGGSHAELQAKAKRPHDRRGRRV
jgi:pseudouridine synthase